MPRGGGGGGHGAASRGQQRRQRGPLRAGLRRGEAGAGQGVAGGPFGVDHVGLAPAAAGRAGRAVQLEDHLLGVAEVAGQAGAVAAGALDRPRPQAAMLLGQFHQLAIAVGVGGHGDRGEQGTVGGRDQRGGVGVGVGVDPDDEFDQFCQHGHRVHS